MTDIKQIITEFRKKFKVSVISLFDLEGITNDRLVNLITNNFDYYVSEQFETLLKQERETLIKKIEGMKKKTGFTPGELLFNVDNQEKEYQVYIFNQALDDLIQLIQGDTKEKVQGE